MGQDSKQLLCPEIHASLEHPGTESSLEAANPAPKLSFTSLKILDDDCTAVI